MTNPHDIIIKPVVTEQSMTEMGNKTYTFAHKSRDVQLIVK